MLGAGGVLGAAWSIGALCALERVTGVDVRTFDIVVGTSAGSVLAALTCAGVRPEELAQHQRGVPVEEGPLAGYTYDHDRATGGSLPSRPKPGLGSHRLLMRSVRRPWSVTPMAAMSSLLPTGTGSLWTVRSLVDAFTPEDAWSPHPNAWIVAMDYDTGRRVAFGRADSPPASLAEAVLASCAIPGWYAPVAIGGRRYVDGGTCSPASADLVIGQGLDEVVVLAPMASFEYDNPTAVPARVERSFRRSVSRRVVREAAKVRADGTRVTVLTPGRRDLEAMGANLMDPSRRIAVLDCSLETSEAALRRSRGDDVSWSA